MGMLNFDTTKKFTWKNSKLLQYGYKFYQTIWN